MTSRAIIAMLLFPNKDPDIAFSDGWCLWQIRYKTRNGFPNAKN